MRCRVRWRATSEPGRSAPSAWSSRAVAPRLPPMTLNWRSEHTVLGGAQIAIMISDDLLDWFDGRVNLVKGLDEEGGGPGVVVVPSASSLIARCQRMCHSRCDIRVGAGIPGSATSPHFQYPGARHVPTSVALRFSSAPIDRPWTPIAGTFVVHRRSRSRAADCRSESAA
jgi:hypothetical protein